MSLSDIAGAVTIDLTEDSTSRLLQMLEDQDKEYLDRLFAGQEKLTLYRGSQTITLVPEAAKEGP